MLSARIANRFTIEDRLGPGFIRALQGSRYARPMLHWIWIPILYALAFGLFGWLGGIASAGDAIARWGRETAERRRCALSPCS